MHVVIEVMKLNQRKEGGCKGSEDQGEADDWLWPKKETTLNSLQPGRDNFTLFTQKYLNTVKTIKPFKKNIKLYFVGQLELQLLTSRGCCTFTLITELSNDIVNIIAYNEIEHNL